MKIRRVLTLLLIIVMAISFLGTTPALAEVDGDEHKGQNLDKDRGDKDKDRDTDRIPVGWYVDRTNPGR